jgi:uncharacterized membrane protein (Fun14 family)
LEKQRQKAFALLIGVLTISLQHLQKKKASEYRGFFCGG